MESMNEIRLIATGSYRYPMPPDLMNALRESIIQHMKAYGVTEIQVEGGHVAEAKTEAPKPDYDGVPVWDISGTLLGEKFKEHLAKPEGNFTESPKPPDHADIRLWTVYERPSDFPKSWVARLWVGDQPTGSIVIAPALELLRGQMMEMRLTRIPRHAEDDPVIVEVWL